MIGFRNGGGFETAVPFSKIVVVVFGKSYGDEATVMMGQLHIVATIVRFEFTLTEFLKSHIHARTCYLVDSNRRPFLIINSNRFFVSIFSIPFIPIRFTLRILYRGKKHVKYRVEFSISR